MKTIVISFVCLSLLSYLLTCWAIVDVASRKFTTLPKKILWGAIAFIPFCGWVVYFLWGKKQGLRP